MIVNLKRNKISTHLKTKLSNKKNQNKNNVNLKKKVFVYLNKGTKRRDISNRVFLGDTVSPYDRSSAIDRTAANYDDAKEKV